MPHPPNAIGQYTIRSMTYLPNRPVRTIERQERPDVVGTEAKMLAKYGNAERWATYSDASVCVYRRWTKIQAN